jgi:hypothetical protein
VFSNSMSVFSLTLLFPLNLKQSPLVHSLHSLDAHLAELYRILNNFVSLCLPLHSLSSKVFSNLEASPLSLQFLWCALLTRSFLNSTQNSNVHSLHWLTESSTLCHALLAFSHKEPRLKSTTHRQEILSIPADGI